MQQVLEKLEQELKNVKRAMRLGKSALEEGLEVQQEAEELRASFSAFSEGLGGALKALREHYASLKEDDLELEKSLTKLKHAQAKIAASLSALEKPDSTQEVLEVLEGLQNSVTDLESVLGAIASKPSQPTPQNFSTPKGAKKYCPQSKEELKKLVADESVHLGDIDISKITDLSYVFSHSTGVGVPPAFTRKNFEGLETWDTSHVTDMRNMFNNAIHFDHDISSWNVSRVECMSGMFSHCICFNQPLNNWSVSSVVEMWCMFFCCENFNQPLNNWDVSSVEKMGGMFAKCKNFNQSLNNWNISSAKSIDGMFNGCSSFNQSLNNWDVSSVTDMGRMFNGCTSLTTLPHWYRA
ncbi:BspA family leucine-rich repeat surface protein [Helicobacter felis]|uniref:BspA family leucine-rich repeat surface protein n=1 Tax=Helicobacter felis TaxID=214 RepID=UPI000CF023A9|nr:BspA family leucine-rich repeat surface protein [Helicobacter felis]